MVAKRARALQETNATKTPRLAHQNELANQILVDLGRGSEVFFTHEDNS